MSTPIFGQIIDLDGVSSSPASEDSRLINTIKFTAFEPPSNSVTANYQDQPVRGRSSPHLFYSDTSPDIWNFSIQLRASAEQYDLRSHKTVWSEWLFLKSLQYPDYGVEGKGPTRPPRVVDILFGEVLQLTGVIVGPQAQWVRPYDANGYPYGIDVSFTFRVTTDSQPFDFREIRRGT